MDEETQEMQWDTIGRIVEKIDTEAERLKWDGLIDELSHIFNAKTDDMSSEELLFTLLQYLYRLLWRVRKFDSPQKFNQIFRETCLENHEDKEYYRVNNYDYKFFCWAQAKHLTDIVDNNNILVPKSILKPSEIKHFEQKVQENS